MSSYLPMSPTAKSAAALLAQKGKDERSPNVAATIWYSGIDAAGRMYRLL